MTTVRVLDKTEKRVRAGVRGDRYYLSGIDLLPTHTGIPIVWVYPNGLDLPRFEAALVETLKKYPVMASRLRTDEHGHVFVDPCDGGVNLRVRRCAGKLPAYGPDRHMDGHISRYSTPILPWRVVDRDQPMLEIDVSRFEDGGVVLCITAVHSVCDGTSFFGFVNEWARACAGHAPVGPTSDREVMIALGRAHADKPYVGKVLYEPTMLERASLYTRFAWHHLTSIRKGVFRISADRIEQWKHDSRHELADGEFVGTVDLVTAHCLKVLSPAMSARGDRRVGVVSDLRYKRGLGVPRAFFGNALTQAQIVYGEDEVATESPVALARKMRAASVADDTEELSSYLAHVERYRQKHAVGKLLMRTVAATLGAGMMVNNYRPFPIYEIDFGTGRPSWHDNPRLVYRALKVVSTPEMDGGVDIHLTAHRKEIAVARAAYA